jgi:GTP-binding protein
VAILGPPNAGKSTLFNRLLDKNVHATYRLHAEKKNKRGKSHKLGRRSSSRHKGGGKQPGAPRGGVALVSAVPGTTRDRRQATGRIGSVRFRLCDTAGVDGLRLEAWYAGGTAAAGTPHRLSREAEEDDDDYQRPMMEQAALAARGAAVIFFLFDGRIGLTADDLATLRWLRRHVLQSNHSLATTGLAAPQRVVLVANKLEGNLLEDHPMYDDFVTEAAHAGFGPALVISALQGEGLADLALVLLEAQQARGLLDDNDNDSDQDPDRIRPLQMAILGRPNVGKSTLVNTLLQEQRVITGSRPGLTRDAIRIPWTWQDQEIQLVDTAGIRKASQRKDALPAALSASETSSPALLEDMAVQDAVRALQVADVAVLVLDAGVRSLSKQDLSIAAAILREGRALVVVANKMDLVIGAGPGASNPHGNDNHDDNQDENENDDAVGVVNDYTKQDLARGVRQQLEERFPYLRKTPIIPLDSLRGQSVADELMPIVLQARARWERKITTGMLNRWLHEVVEGHAPPPVGGRRTKLKYILQTKGRPPTFLLYTNQTELHESYLRYLTRQFQDSFDLYGMQVRLAVKKSTSSEGSNPYHTPGERKRSGSGLGGRQARHGRAMERLRTTGSTKQRRGKRRSPED